MAAMRNSIILFDRDARRRASLCHSLSDIWHVEPFDDISDLASYRPTRVKLALVEDRGTDVRDVARVTSSQTDVIPVVAYADQIDVQAVVDQLHDGAADYLQLPFDHDTIDARLTVSIDRCRADIERRRRSMEARQQLSVLSAREGEVIRSIANGGTNKIIARELGISPRTVEIHRANMMRKLDLESPAAVARIALEAGIVS